MSKSWVEVRSGDYVYFSGKNGQGSVVKTEGDGNYFIPAKIGISLPGKKFPILNDEPFILNSSKVLKVDKDKRVVKVFLTRVSDGLPFAISESQLHQYFIKKDESSLGAIY